MATTNQIKTRILNKMSTWSEWKSVENTFVPLRGEICIVEIPNSTSNTGLTPPAIGIKVGIWNGVEGDASQKAFKDLPWIQAVAGDIPAKLKTAAGIDAEIANLVSNRKLATVEELNDLDSRVQSLETRTTDATIGNQALSTRIEGLSSSKVDKSVAEAATSSDQLIKKSTAQGLADTAKTEAINAAKNSAAELYETKGTAKDLVDAAESSINEKIGSEITFSKTNTIAQNIKDLQDSIGSSGSIGSTVADLSERMEAVEGTVGDSSKGLVKDVADLKTTVGDSNNGLVKDVSDLKSAITDSGALGSRVATLESVTKGYTAEGSIKTAIDGVAQTASANATEIARVNGVLVNALENNAEGLDSIKELAAWIEEHGEDAAGYAEAIGKLEGKVNLGENETVTGHVSSAISTHYTNTVQPAISAVDKKFENYTTTANLSSTYATKAYADQAEADAVTTAIGTSGDTSAKNTIYGAKAFATEKANAALGEAKTYADQAETDAVAAAKQYTDSEVSTLKTGVINTAQVTANEAKEAITGFKTAFGASGFASDKGIIDSVTYDESGSVTYVRRKIKPIDMSDDSNDVFIFYCGTATEVV